MVIPWHRFLAGNPSSFGVGVRRTANARPAWTTYQDTVPKKKKKRGGYRAQ